MCSVLEIRQVPIENVAVTNLLCICAVLHIALPPAILFYMQSYIRKEQFRMRANRLGRIEKARETETHTNTQESDQNIECNFG